MGKEYTAKSFKSGNSVALRMPAALGIAPDREWVIIRAGAKLVIEEKPAPRRFLDVDRFWGKAAGMVHMPSPREDFEERPSALKKAG